MTLPARAISCFCVTILLLTGVLPTSPARADASGDPTAVGQEEGKYVDKEGNPTYKIDQDGKVDFYTYAGFVRYSANCMQCHGPDGLGSTYAPSLVNSLKTLSYGDLFMIVANGRQKVSASQDLVMPSLGNNKNIMCYLDAIFVYLRARANDAVGRGRPVDHEPKPAAFTAAENECMG